MKQTQKSLAHRGLVVTVYSVRNEHMDLEGTADKIFGATQAPSGVGFSTVIRIP